MVVTLVVVTDNTDLRRVHTFPTVVSDKLRIVVRRGPDAQMNYGRINELDVW